jgi:nucleotide-binding universal stress UspA family protein
MVPTNVINMSSPLHPSFTETDDDGLWGDTGLPGSFLKGLPMRILLATDGSAHARAAEEWVIGLPLWPADSVSALTFIPSEPRPNVRHMADRSRSGHGIAHPARPSAAAQVSERARERLASQAQTLDTIIRVGSPAEQMLRTFDEIRPDLVVLGSRERNALQRTLSGSVSEQVARKADCSVVVVRTPAAPRRILLAIDQIRYAYTGVEVLARLPLPVETSVLLLVVMPPVRQALLAAHTADTWARLLRRRADQRRMAEAIAHQAEETFGSAGWRTEVRFAVGDPSKTVVEAVAQQQVDLVVVGAPHGSGGEPALPTDGVALQVLRHAPCSVLIARSDPHVDPEREASAPWAA